MNHCHTACAAVQGHPHAAGVIIYRCHTALCHWCHYELMSYCSLCHVQGHPHATGVLMNHCHTALCCWCRCESLSCCSLCGCSGISPCRWCRRAWSTATCVNWPWPAWRAWAPSAVTCAPAKWASRRSTTRSSPTRSVSCHTHCEAKSRSVRAIVSWCSHL